MFDFPPRVPDVPLDAAAKPMAATINGDRSVSEISTADLVKRAVMNARPHRCGEAPRWVAVMDAFALGSTHAYELCRLHGLDPEETRSGARCVACEP